MRVVEKIKRALSVKEHPSPWMHHNDGKKNSVHSSKLMTILRRLNHIFIEGAK